MILNSKSIGKRHECVNQDHVPPAASGGATETGPRMTLAAKVGAASLIMMASIFLSRIMGLVREMVIAYIGGAGGDVDAYQVAFVVPEILNHMLASGFLSVTFIPIFTRYLTTDRQAEGWRACSNILWIFGTLMSLFILICMVWADKLVPLAAPGLSSPKLLARAVTMTRIVLPAQLFFFVGGLFMAIQFAMGRFAIPALAPLIYNLGIIAGGLLLGQSRGMEGFSWGALAGAIIGNFFLQAWGARKVGFRLSWRFAVSDPDLKTYVTRSIPLMIGVTMVFSTEFFLKFFGSYLPAGSIASLNYGLRVMFMMVGLFGQAAGVASFPFLARLAAEGNLAEMNRLLNRTLRYLSLIIPFSILMIVLRFEVIRILFQRGRFDAADTALTAAVLACLMLGAFAFAAQTIVVRGYYARENTLFPSVFGTVFALASVPLYILGMRMMGAPGVGLAVSVTAMLQVGVLYALWSRDTANVGSRAVALLCLKMAGIGLISGTLAAGLRHAMANLDILSMVGGDWVVVITCGGGFIGLLALAGRFFNVREINAFTEQIGRIIAKIKP